MPVHDELGKRMKENYEQITKYRLTRRMPVIVRIDGRAFHTLTRGFKKPFDPILMRSMQETMKYLCENVQGCVAGYTQSDEISLLLIDYKDLNSQAWFDNEIQKISSISASMATMEFNRVFRVLVGLFSDDMNLVNNTEREIGKSQSNWSTADFKDHYEDNSDFYDQCEVYDRVSGSAMFDARCFNIPKEEVTNYFYWRQIDATRNSIEMVGRAYFSHKELHEKTCNDIQDMLHEQKGVNWNDIPTAQKRGSCCIKSENGWIIDTEIPIFKGDGRDYIEKYVFVGD